MRGCGEKEQITHGTIEKSLDVVISEGGKGIKVGM